MTVLIVGCRNEHGVDEDKTFSIDIDDNHLTNIMKGNKISYGESFLKIGRCKISIVSHRVFGGSWCFEEFYTSDKQIRKLLKYLKKTCDWTVEVGSEEFCTWWDKK